MTGASGSAAGRTVETIPVERGHLALDFVKTMGGLRDDLLYPTFRALADGEQPPVELLDRLRDEERAALAGEHLDRAGGGRRGAGRSRRPERLGT
jgi:hypothetical protein